MNPTDLGATEEVQNLRASLRQSRQDHQALEAQVRELRSTDTSTKVGPLSIPPVHANQHPRQFKLETHAQQLALAQSETERVSTELTAKSEEYANYRRTKHAEFAQLQSAHDSLTQKHALAESSVRAMQSAQAASTQQLTQALTKVQDLQGRLAEQEAAFTAEVSGLKRLVTIMEEREKQAKDIVENIEREWAGVGDRAEKREAALRAETEKEQRAREEAEKRLEQLETVMERMHRGELPIAGRDTSFPATPGRASSSHNYAADAMLGFSPTVAMASRVQKSGKTFTQVYADYVRLEEEYAKKCAEYDHMDRTLSDVLAQIEERVSVSTRGMMWSLAYHGLRLPSWPNSARNTNASGKNPHNSPPSSQPLSPNVMLVPFPSEKCRRSLRSCTKRLTFSNISSQT